MPKATMPQGQWVPLEERQARYDEMKYLRDQKGWTYEQLAEKYGLKRQRVSQILKRARPIRQYGGRPRKAA